MPKPASVAAKPRTLPLGKVYRLLEPGPVVLLTLLLAGCSGNVQNPVDRITFRDEPLVRDVETGMSQEQVLAIGGAVSAMHANLESLYFAKGLTRMRAQISAIQVAIRAGKNILELIE